MIRGTKEIVARNPELTMIDILKPFLKKHHWPPGNSQTQITTFDVQTKITQKCQYPNCSETAKYADTAQHGGVVFCCEKHHEHAVEKRLLKSSKRL